jgi:hypothetical protein
MIRTLNQLLSAFARSSRVAVVLCCAVAACSPPALPPAGTQPSDSAATPASTNPAAPVQFPSLNGRLSISLTVPTGTLQAVFRHGDRSVTGPVDVAAGVISLQRPVAAPLQGSVSITDGQATLWDRAYDTDATSLDIRVLANGLSTAFRIAPAETEAVAGDRQIRVPINTALTVSLKTNQVIGQAQVDDTGTTSVLSGALGGGMAELSITTKPIRLDLATTGIPLSLLPFEEAPQSGSRQVLVPVPFSGMALAKASNHLIADGLSVAADGTVQDPSGATDSGPLAIRPLTTALPISAGGSTVPWCLFRYESTFAAGDRVVSVLKNDDAMEICFGTTNTATPFFGPKGPLPSCLKWAPSGTGIVFNVLPVTLDPGDFKGKFFLHPYETTPAAGPRTLLLMRDVAFGWMGFYPSYPTFGEVKVTANGVEVTGGLRRTASGISLATTTVRIVQNGTPQPYRIWPVESDMRVGSRSVVLVLGGEYAMQTDDRLLPVHVSADGQLSASSPELSASGSVLQVTL